MIVKDEMEYKYLLSIAGEFRVCSELLKRGIHATITLGNKKGVDIFIYNKDTNQTKSIEVKTTQKNNFMTMLFQKYKMENQTHPDYWILFSTKQKADGKFDENFYILEHNDIVKLQKKMNKVEDLPYSKCVEKSNPGTDNIRINLLESFRDKWETLSV
jgi:hypothetical protein